MKWLITLVRLLLVLGAMVRLQWSLRQRGFQGVFSEHVRRYHLVPAGRRRPDWPEQLEEWLTVIDLACRLVPWDARCLQRSFLGYRFLRQRLGLRVNLLVGVRKFPFSAHAWLVLAGRCVNEDSALVSGYIPILNAEGERERAVSRWLP